MLYVLTNDQLPYGECDECCGLCVFYGRTAGYNWYQCRDCGLDHAEPVPPKAVEDIAPSDVPF